MSEKIDSIKAENSLATSIKYKVNDGMQFFNKFFLLLLLQCIVNFSYATTWTLPKRGDLVGKIQSSISQPGETLSDVGIRYNVGYYEMINANPGIDANRPLLPRTKLIIPSQYILPPLPRHGIIINLAEYRLYFYPNNKNVVITMPVGIGLDGWNTPVGLTRVVSKEENPIWHPTDNVRAEAAKHGIPLPDTLSPGEDNPLGKHILRLGWATYLIHGTNRWDGVGSRVSAGCIRMMPEDVETLYKLVDVGTPVNIINNNIKRGNLNGRQYVEIHPRLDKNDTSIKKILHQQWIHGNKIINDELKQPSGIPKTID